MGRRKKSEILLEKAKEELERLEQEEIAEQNRLERMARERAEDTGTVIGVGAFIIACVLLLVYAICPIVHHLYASYKEKAGIKQESVEYQEYLKEEIVGEWCQRYHGECRWRKFRQSDLLDRHDGYWKIREKKCSGGNYQWCMESINWIKDPKVLMYKDQPDLYQDGRDKVEEELFPKEEDSWGDAFIISHDNLAHIGDWPPRLESNAMRVDPPVEDKRGDYLSLTIDLSKGDIVASGISRDQTFLNMKENFNW